MTAGKLAWRRVECAADDGAGGRRVFCVFCAFGGPRPEVRGAAPALREWRAAAEGSEPRAVLSELIVAQQARDLERELGFLHPFFLCMEDELPPVLDELADRALSAFSASSLQNAQQTPSRFQKRVGQRFLDRRLTHRVREELGVQSYAADATVLDEHVLLADGYSVDVYMPGYRLIIEADGPQHWTVNTQQPLGRTLLKHRLLRSRGYVVVSVDQNVVLGSGALATARGLVPMSCSLLPCLCCLSLFQGWLAHLLQL